MGQCLSGNQAGPANDAGNQSGAAGPRQISLNKIKNATKKFKEQIGEGGSATVYKGRLEDGQIVAVKRLRPAVTRNADYECEVKMLTTLSHPNIINLVGFCVHNSEHHIERIVVYEHMPLRSLYDWLHARQDGEAALDWSTRMMIGAGIAKGLSYLHNEAEPKVIFGNLKPADVLLGRGYHPKISDFGGAIESVGAFVHINRSENRRMTSPYWEPEAVKCGKLSPKSDVYSFGVLLLEIIIRIVPRDTSLVRFVHDALARDAAAFVGLADPELEGQFDEGEVRKAMSLASRCMLNSRPAMNDVVRAMNYLAGEPNAEWPYA